MIAGVGIDLVKIDRMDSWLKTTGLVHRYFSIAECDYCLRQVGNGLASLAARFAAKEAFGKALGCGLRGLNLRDIEVVIDNTSQPQLALYGNAKKKMDQKGRLRPYLSLSHEKDYAIALVILEVATEK